MVATLRTNPERITALEVEVGHLREEQSEFKDVITKLESIIVKQNEKLDSLLELKAKGMGAVWLASLVFGSGILGIGYFVVQWMRGEV